VEEGRKEREREKKRQRESFFAAALFSFKNRLAPGNVAPPPPLHLIFLGHPPSLPFANEEKQQQKRSSCWCKFLFHVYRI